MLARMIQFCSVISIRLCTHCIVVDRRAGRQRRRRPGQKRLSDRRDDRAPQEGHCRQGHQVLQRDRPVQACRRCRDQAAALGAARSSAIRRSGRSSSPPIANAGLDWPVRLLVLRERQGRGLDRLHRFRLDRAAARHQESQGSVQDGVDRDRVRSRRASRRSSVLCDSDCVSTREPIGISVRNPFDRSSAPLTASHRPRRNRGDHGHVQSQHDQPRRRPQASSSRASSRLRRRRRFDRRIAGECPADKFKADVRAAGHHAGQGRHRHRARRHRLGKGAGQDQGPSAALPQAHDRARRRRALAQPRRPPRHHLHRRRRDRRIRQQLLGADRAQGRRDQAGDQRHRRTGGRTTAARPSCSSSAMSSTTRHDQATCDDTRR